MTLFDWWFVWFIQGYRVGRVGACRKNIDTENNFWRRKVFLIPLLINSIFSAADFSRFFQTFFIIFLHRFGLFSILLFEASVLEKMREKLKLLPSNLISWWYFSSVCELRVLPMGRIFSATILLLSNDVLDFSSSFSFVVS